MDKSRFLFFPGVQFFFLLPLSPSRWVFFPGGLALSSEGVQPVVSTRRVAFFCLMRLFCQDCLIRISLFVEGFFGFMTFPTRSRADTRLCRASGSLAGGDFLTFSLTTEGIVFFAASLFCLDLSFPFSAVESNPPFDFPLDCRSLVVEIPPYIQKSLPPSVFVSPLSCLGDDPFFIPPKRSAGILRPQLRFSFLTGHVPPPRAIYFSFSFFLFPAIPLVP